MPATPGYKAKLYKNGVLFAGVRTKGLTLGNEAVDITSDDDDAFRTLMARSGQKQLDMSVEGVAKDADLIKAAIDDVDLIEPYTMVFEDFNMQVEGNFKMSNVQISASYKESITFSAEIMSSGPYSWSPA